MAPKIEGKVGIVCLENKHDMFEIGHPDGNVLLI